MLCAGAAVTSWGCCGSVQGMLCLRPQGQAISGLSAQPSAPARPPRPLAQARSLRRAQDVRKQLVAIMDRYKLDLVSGGLNFLLHQILLQLGRDEAEAGPAIGWLLPHPTMHAAGPSPTPARHPLSALPATHLPTHPPTRSRPQLPEDPEGRLLPFEPILPHLPCFLTTAAGRNYQKIQKAICSGFFFHAARKDAQEGYKTGACALRLARLAAFLFCCVCSC